MDRIRKSFIYGATAIRLLLQNYRLNSEEIANGRKEGMH
tara:strand:- start:106 stop:222 length:117 start_codon:yes stop_codon:yes gene_type:complete